MDCLNKELSVQQVRHKRMTQAMLDLRLMYWNCRRSGSGPRWGACPHEHPGLGLPTFEFLGWLVMDHARLTQEPSTHWDGPWDSTDYSDSIRATNPFLSISCGI